MLYRAPDGTVTEITTTGQPLGNALMVGAGGVPVWGEGSDTLAVRNESGSPMTKGQVVRISGFSVGEDLPTVVLAQADSAVNARAVAMLAEDIADNANGSAVITGIIEGLDTAAFGAGSLLYLSDTVAGAVVQSPPKNPEYTTFIGWTRRASGGTNGSILVKVEGEKRPIGNSFAFGGDATAASVGDFLLAHGIATDPLIGPNGGPPAFNSEIIVPLGCDGILDSLAWSTATGSGGPPPPSALDLTIWQNGVAGPTVTLTPATAPQGSLFFTGVGSPFAVTGGDAVAVEWSGGTVNPGGMVVELYAQRS
jgi:hypothetical protein